MQESRLLLPLWWSALFPVRHSKTEKRKIKIKCAYCLKVPTFPDWSPGAATLLSCEEWSDPIHSGNKDSIYFFLNGGERWQFEKNSIRFQKRLCTGRQHYLAKKQTHTILFFHTGPTDDDISDKFKLRWMKSALAYLQIWFETGGFGLHRDCEDHKLWAWFPKIQRPCLTKGIDKLRYINIKAILFQALFIKTVLGLHFNPKANKVTCNFCS